MAQINVILIAEYARRFLRHKSFRTQVQRIGKVVRVSGTVESVELGAVPRVTPRSNLTVLMFFDPDDYDPEPVLLSLNVGDRITVSGQIWQLQSPVVTLDHCKLLDARGPGSQP